MESVEPERLTSTALRERGNAFYKKYQLIEALGAYEEAARLEPDDPLPLSNLSAVFFEVGNYAKCTVQTKKALELLGNGNPSLARRLRLRLIHAYLHLRLFDKAHEVFTRSDLEDNEFDVLQRIISKMVLLWGPKLDSPRKHTLTKLARYKPTLEANPELFVFGHDTAQSLYDGHLAATTKTDDVISILFSGIGDARNLYATFLRIAREELDKPTQRNFQFVANDIMPQAIARDLLVWLLLDEMGAMRSSPQQTCILNTLFFLYSAPILPQYVYDTLQTTIAKAIVALQEDRLPAWIFVPENDRPKLIRALRQWEQEAPDLYSTQELIDMTVRKNQNVFEQYPRGVQIEIKRSIPKECKDEDACYDRTCALFPAPDILNAQNEEFGALVRAFKNKKTSATIKNIERHVAENWKLNVTGINVEAELIDRGSADAGFEPFKLLDFLFGSGGHAEVEAPTDPKSLYDSVAKFFLEVASAITKIQGRFVVSTACGEVCDMLQNIRYGFREAPKKDGSTEETSWRQCPKNFDRIHLSNIPDYIGGNLSSFLYAIPILKTHKASFITSNCLRNSNLWASADDFNNEYLLVNDGTTLFKLFQVALVEDEDDFMKQLMPSPMPMVEYVKYNRPSNKRLNYPNWLPRPALMKWLYGLFFKLAVPVPRRFIRYHSLIWTPLNLTIFLQLLIHLPTLGYPPHWLSTVLTNILRNQVSTSARPPQSYPLTIDEVREDNPVKKLSTAPFITEMSTLTAMFHRFLPFAVLDPDLPELESIHHYTVTFERVKYFDANRPDFVLILTDRAKTGRADADTEANMRSYLIGTSEPESLAVVDLREKGLHMITTWEWDRKSDTATFWLRDDVLQTPEPAVLDVAIWRTDTWRMSSEAVLVRLGAGIKKGKAWYKGGIAELPLRF